jgi:hypothetical protein
MEAGISTKPSCESCATEAAVGASNLEFPVEPDFRSLPPWVPMDVMIERIEDFRRWFPNAIPTEEERLAAKVSEEFALK